MTYSETLSCGSGHLWKFEHSNKSHQFRVSNPQMRQPAKHQDFFFNCSEQLSEFPSQSAFDGAVTADLVFLMTFDFSDDIWCPVCRAPLNILALLPSDDPHHKLAERAAPVPNSQFPESPQHHEPEISEG